MRQKSLLHWLWFVVILSILLPPAEQAQARPPQSPHAQSEAVTAFDLILAMNTLRMANGLPPLVEDPIVMAVAQSTAEIMAANQMSWHIGDVRGRIAAAGYGGGAQVWATENFAVGNMSIDQIMVVWADPDHMIPAVKPAYCHVGAGVAKASNDRYYYVLQAAYTSSGSCGDNTPPSNKQPPGGSSGENPNVPNPVPQWIIPVKVATPDAEQKVFHVVEPGQSFWAIAVAYQVTIRDIEIWNNLSKDSKLQIGQRLFIPSSSTEGYATPTPIGMILPSTPDADGVVVHTVQSHQTLITIAEAYGVTVAALLSLNGIQEEWPLQIGQVLLVNPGRVTPTPTPQPLTPLERLTPESDGRLYHTVQSGETLSGIAGYYGVPLADLMAWNGLNSASIIRPEQKLVLQVEPPVTSTATPGPPSATAAAIPTAKPSTTSTPTRTALRPTATPAPVSQAALPVTTWPYFAALAVAGLILFGLISRKKP